MLEKLPDVVVLVAHVFVVVVVAVAALNNAHLFINLTKSHCSFMQISQYYSIFFFNKITEPCQAFERSQNQSYQKRNKFFKGKKSVEKNLMYCMIILYAYYIITIN